MVKVIEKAKWMLFSVVSFLNNLRTGSSQAKKQATISNYLKSDGYLWIFCSTIGELNACRPFIDHLYNRPERLVLITDRDCYKESYLRHYPDAVIVELTGNYNDSKHLCKKLPPAMLVICEIPCTLHDAPCRLSYGIIRAVKNRVKPVYLVNGWLYGYQPSSRMDVIEKRLFEKDYLSAFDKITVQTEAVMKRLIEQGISPDKVRVTGNMKFDSVINERPKLNDTQANQIIDYLLESEKTVLIAGCIGDIDEFKGLLELFKRLKTTHDIMAVFAPRHPENTLLMDSIDAVLCEGNTSYGYKSKTEDTSLKGIDLLVLDTIGELKAFFYCGDICYMGKNHNILEPLSFGKSVFTLSGWEKTYPSYPVYQITSERGLIHTFGNYDEIALFVARDTTLNQQKSVNEINEKLERLKGANKLNKTFISI